MYKTLNKKIEKAYAKLNEAECAVSEIFTMLRFDGFTEDSLPMISHSHGVEIFLVYKGFEIQIEQAVNLMKANGSIKPEDFNLFCKD